MSIITKNGVKFSFIAENGLETIAPEGVKVYVHVTDCGNGTHAINGKIIKELETGIQELGWIRTNEVLPSNTVNILEEAYTILINILSSNTDVQFESTL